MMYRPYKSGDLIVRTEKWTDLIIGLPFLAIAAVGLFFDAGTRHFLRSNLWIAVFAAIAFLIAAFLLIRSGMDKRLKLVVSKEGIWTPAKGLLQWKDIEYYDIKEIYEDIESADQLKIKLLGQSKELTINLKHLDKSMGDIRRAIIYNADGFNIDSLKKTS
jgi:hypothetical protein